MKWGTAVGFLLFAIMLCQLSCAETHTVRLDGSFLSDKDTVIAGYRADIGAKVDMQCRDTDGKIWDLREIAHGDGFALLGASIRFYVEDAVGHNQYLIWRALDDKMHTFSMRSSGGNYLHAGWNMIDATALFSSWLEDNEPICGFALSCVGGKKGHGVIMRNRISFTVTFSTEEKMGLFSDDRISETEMLDGAFSLLEEGNVFLERYDYTADSLTTAIYPLGVPYYFGGHNENKILQVFYPLQESHYFKADRKYLCGFDCAGYTNWCLRQAGFEEHPDLDSILGRGSDSFFLDPKHPETWPYYCLPGDFITVTHGYDHVMIYLGTLRTFGFDADEVGEAAKYMDYPLVIHCGSNPFYYERYAEYLKEKGQRSITPTDGGVTVSIVMADNRMAQATKKAVWGTTYGYFSFNETPLLIFPLNDCTDFAWYCPSS